MPDVVLPHDKTLPFRLRAGEALEATGGAQLIANGLLRISGQLPASTVLIIVLVFTMFLSDLVNNAAAFMLTAPISISVAQGLGASVDSFLMAIAIGASCAFLTPIGHQSNTLVMGPGGYKFNERAVRFGRTAFFYVIMAFHEQT